ncbi:MAG: hypothetical protein LAT50_05355, partial [Ectothiorhodospiraceae bacterium]|nr:hypothetical protein [Ectothiorhodospiraceae bacterium]
DPWLALKGVDRLPPGGLDQRPPARVLVAPGHGPRDLATPDLLERIAASDVLVSTDADNRWGLPHPEVRSNVTEWGGRLWVTGCDGALSVRLGNGAEVTATERGRYWWRQARGQNCEP